MKKVIKDLVPPMALRLYKQWARANVRYSAGFNTWEQAKQASSGYDSKEILDKVSSALLQVRSGKAAYEQDSVLFKKLELPYEVLATLLRAACESQCNLEVLDFGGSLGSTYFQCRDYLSPLKELKWSIVEQAEYVKRGQDLFESEQLRFYFSIYDCLKENKPQVALFSSVLQYLEQPHQIVQEIVESDIPYVVVNRTPFVEGDDDCLVVQHVPKKIYKASIPCWILGQQRFSNDFAREFDLIDTYVNRDAGVVINGKEMRFMGLVWKRKRKGRISVIQ